MASELLMWYLLEGHHYIAEECRETVLHHPLYDAERDDPFGDLTDAINDALKTAYRTVKDYPWFREECPVSTELAQAVVDACHIETFFPMYRVLNQDGRDAVDEIVLLNLEERHKRHTARRRG